VCPGLVVGTPFGVVFFLKASSWLHPCPSDQATTKHLGYHVLHEAASLEPIVCLCRRLCVDADGAASWRAFSMMVLC
jgi:hypothetical protein